MEIEKYRTLRLETITRRQEFLNDTVYRSLAIYHALITAIAGIAAGIRVMQSKVDAINSDIADSIHFLLLVWTFLSVYMIINMISCMCSWYSYRKEESELANELTGEEVRQLPQLSNAWRWMETWFIVYCAGITSVAWWAKATLLSP